MSFEEFAENLVFSATYIGGGDRFLTVHSEARRRLTDRYGYEGLRQLLMFARFRVLSRKVREAIERDARALVGHMIIEPNGAS